MRRRSSEPAAPATAEPGQLLVEDPLSRAAVVQQARGVEPQSGQHRQCWEMHVMHGGKTIEVVQFGPHIPVDLDAVDLGRLHVDQVVRLAHDAR